MANPNSNPNSNSQLKTMFIGLLIIFLLFLLFALYKKRDLLTTINTEEGFNNNKNITFRLFYTDWCPHCQNIKPEFKKLITSWNMAKREMYWENNKLNYKDVKIEMVNCEKTKETCNNYDVQGYPTMILSIGDKNIEYTGEGTSKSDLMRFLETNLLKMGITYN